MRPTVFGTLLAFAGAAERAVASHTSGLTSCHVLDGLRERHWETSRFQPLDAAVEIGAADQVR